MWGRQIVLAQSSSASYQAVEFINAESSLSSSSSYQLTDSVDYYGGTANSGNYKECTGDAAVLSDCSFAIPPVFLPPTPIPVGNGAQTLVGAGSIYYAHDDCNQVDCLENTAFEDTEAGAPNQSEEDDHSTGSEQTIQLPGIKESLSGQREDGAMSPQFEKLDESFAVTEVVGKESKLDQGKFDSVMEVVASRLAEELIKAKTAVWCEDLTCAPLKYSAVTQAARLCSIYTFGGYQIPLSCLDGVLMAVVGALVLLFVGRMILMNKRN